MVGVAADAWPSRAAVLASLLPVDADREKFLHVLGIHGDPVAVREQIDRARRTGVRVASPYGYERAFKYSPMASDSGWLGEALPDYRTVTVLDPTAAGGTGYFSAGALALAARGIEGLVRNGGLVRLVVGRTLEPPEIETSRPDPLDTRPDAAGERVQSLGAREYALLVPGMTERLRVTTSPEYFERARRSPELWSPGNPLFVEASNGSRPTGR